MTFLYLNSDRMGAGDDVLGRRLLVAFLRELAASDVQVDVVGCVNDGVRLTTRGSDALPHLEALAARGAHIATCGTCLDHHGMRDALAIGDVGNMAGTVQIMAMADRVIRPC
ncbi:MAG: sulfurtransferase-like selenium metabolism protein YedF [Deltaproteobacteria bacterium]|nr:MAG: sulfurtransferase-like selenium metabolism protein YedF [Deltaproteobacteria bacterium]